MRDKAIERLIKAERSRQKRVVNLIPSENYVSQDVLTALGSEFNNKYAEGYSKLRYYGGNEVIDELEILCKARALKLFKLKSSEWAVNVQPLSGSPANLAVYAALVPLGGKIMGMRLDHGGHLTHGHKVSFTGKVWNWVHYGVDRDSELLDYAAIKEQALKEKPVLIVAGFTAYPHIIDFKKFREIANACGALLMVDMSHFAGLVAGGVYPSPFPYADVVTTTTHKTLRGPRAAMIFSRKKAAPSLAPVTTGKEGNGSRNQTGRLICELLDKAVFPGLQGGPHANQIAGVAVALAEASTPAFKKYAKQVVSNAKVLASELEKWGWRVVGGGTETHLLLLDTWTRGVTGQAASDALEQAGIIVNKNTIPFDTRGPMDPSGIRLGTPAETTRGKKRADMKNLAKKIDTVLTKLIK
jgi:glycine hydroxymethyltransferase